MKKFVCVVIVASCFGFTLSGCAERVVKSCVPSVGQTTIGLRNPGAAPGENFDRNGNSCGTRNTVRSLGVPFCPPPMVGDENDPRNQIAMQPVNTVTVPVVTPTEYRDVDPLISLGASVNIPQPIQY